MLVRLGISFAIPVVYYVNSIANNTYSVKLDVVVYLQHLNTCMIVVNLQQIGPSMPRYCEPEELAVVYQVAQEILDTTEEVVLTTILVEWEIALCWRSLDAGTLGEEWYYRALLLTCIRGLRGEMRPVFYTAAK